MIFETNGNLQLAAVNNFLIAVDLPCIAVIIPNIVGNVSRIAVDLHKISGN